MNSLQIAMIDTGLVYRKEKEAKEDKRVAKIREHVDCCEEIIFSENGMLWSASWSSGSRPGSSYTAHHSQDVLLATDGNEKKVQDGSRYNYPTTDDSWGRVEVRDFSWVVVNNGSYASWDQSSKYCSVHGWYEQGYSASCEACERGCLEFVGDDKLVCSECDYTEEVDLADCTCNEPDYKQTVIVSDRDLARALADEFGVKVKTQKFDSIFNNRDAIIEYLKGIDEEVDIRDYSEFSYSDSIPETVKLEEWSRPGPSFDHNGYTRIVSTDGVVIEGEQESSYNYPTDNWSGYDSKINDATYLILVWRKYVDHGAQGQNRNEHGYRFYGQFPPEVVEAIQEESN